MECNTPVNGFRKSFSHSVEHCGPTAKRLSLKAISNLNGLPSASQIFQDSCHKLQSATRAVFLSEPIELTLEELYRNVEDICAQKMILELYGNLKVLFSEFVADLHPQFLREGFQLSAVAHCWELYCKKMLLIRNIFLFMDRQLLLLNAQNLQIWDLALKLFREDVITREKVQSRLLCQILDEIRKERCGEAIDRQLLRTVIRMLVDLKAMILFRFIDGKDIFEAFYTKELAKRLLLNKSASVDAEKAMLSKLKQECGPNYTRKMETMFQDIELSKQLSKNFRLSLPDNYSIELSVNVICPASWPPYPQTTANYPPEMLSLREEFTRFYLSHHQGRKLIYEPSLGTCVVRAKFPTTPNLRKELQVSELQALVLLQFNKSDNTPITYATIAENTGIEEKELKRTLLSLAAGKGQRVLIKNPANLEIENEHKFIFNTEFSHRLTRIKFNQIQLKETEQEQVATEERVFADRVAHVDCCIVRIMKTRKTIDHNSLLSEVYKQLQFPLKASDVKKRIENLIERDYMKRDASNAATYHYVS
ncbi:unnamed protein product [Heterobilharzia americana]|nr:unnamed protein product [Heterobilharzia americana]